MAVKCAAASRCSVANAVNSFTTSSPLSKMSAYVFGSWSFRIVAFIPAPSERWNGASDVPLGTLRCLRDANDFANPDPVYDAGTDDRRCEAQGSSRQAIASEPAAFDRCLATA